MSTVAQIGRKYELLKPLLNERQRRLWAAAEALAIGHGGLRRVVEATGLDVRTLRTGMDELRDREAGQPDPLEPDQVRRPGGGRKRCTEADPTLLSDLEALVEPLTRGDPDSSRHAGLTYLIVDMSAPGVEVRPLRQITGEAEFNEIFFSDVRVPADNLLGEVGGGWQVAMTTLLHERGTLGFALQAALEVQIRKLVALARDRGADQLQRDRIAREWVEMQAVRYTNYRSLSALMKTGMPGPEGSISKLVWSEANQRVTKLALEILGPDAALGDDNAPYGGYWQYQQLRSRGNTIEAGTSEVLRNIVAERVLGLPYSR